LTLGFLYYYETADLLRRMVEKRSMIVLMIVLMIVFMQTDYLS